MPQEKKTVQRRKGHDEQDIEETQVSRNEKLGETTDTVLDDIECCLAEVEEENRQAKLREAKGEWDAIWAKFHEDRDFDQARYESQVWQQKYAGVVRMVDCCGGSRPDFSDLDDDGN